MARTSASSVRIALLLYLLALLPRLAFVVLAGRGDLSLDEIEYHLLAKNLAEGHGYRWFFDLKSSFRPPGLPFLLAPLYGLFGPNYFLARIFQTVIGSTIGVMTWLLGRQLLPESAARWAGACAALYPPLLFFSVALMGENVFIPLFTVLLYGLTRVSRAGHLRDALGWALLCGVAAGAAILLRPELTYLLPFLLAWAVWRLPHRGRGVAAAAVTLLVVLLFVAPWSVRNYQLNGRFVYLDTRTGYNLYIGYNESANGTFDLRRAQDPIDAFIEANLAILELPEALEKAEVQELLYRELMAYQFPEALDYPLRSQIDPDAALPDVVMHDWAMAQVRQFIREHPLRALQLVPVKLAYFWDLEHRIFLFAYGNNFVGPLPRPVLGLLLIVLLSPFMALILLSIAGLLFGEWAPHDRALLLLPIGFYSLLHALSFGEARFHYVLITMLCILASAGLHCFRQRRPGKAVGAATPLRRAIALALVLVFLLIWAHGLYVSRERWQAVFRADGHQSGLEF